MKKFKKSTNFFFMVIKNDIPRPFYYRVRRMPASLRLHGERSTTGSSFIYFMVICGINLKYSTMALRVSRLNLMKRLSGHRSSAKSSSVLAKGQK